jgi:hypothetical protein
MNVESFLNLLNRWGTLKLWTACPVQIAAIYSVSWLVPEHAWYLIPLEAFAPRGEHAGRMREVSGGLGVVGDGWRSGDLEIG